MYQKGGLESRVSVLKSAEMVSGKFQSLINLYNVSPRVSYFQSVPATRSIMSRSLNASRSLHMSLNTSSIRLP